MRWQQLQHVAVHGCHARLQSECLPALLVDVKGRPDHQAELQLQATSNRTCHAVGCEDMLEVIEQVHPTVHFILLLGGWHPCRLHCT